MAFRNRPKQNYKWVGGRGESTVSRSSTLVLADVNTLVAPLGNANVVGDWVIERIILNLSIRRLLTTDVDQLGYGVYVQEFDPVTAAITQVHNPISLVAADFETTNKNVLLMGALRVPPCMDVTGLDVNRETDNTEVQFRGRRKLARANHGITLWIATDGVDAIVKLSWMARVLLRAA